MNVKKKRMQIRQMGNEEERKNVWWCLEKQEKGVEGRGDDVLCYWEGVRRQKDRDSDYMLLPPIRVVRFQLYILLRTTLQNPATDIK